MIHAPARALAQSPPAAALRQALRDWFGFPDFRPGQLDVIESVMRGEDTLALMPTGAGKSLCYQLPAMLLPGITLVVSPLIALMKDQYDNLPKPVYERSTFINSSLELAEVERRMADVLAGKVQLIYAAPERLRQQPFVHALARAGLRLLVIDEAHCVSLWGHDFRPDYLFIGKVLGALGEPRLLGMTATATPGVQAEIGTQLGRPMHVVQTSPFRPNLFYQVLHLKHQKEKLDALVRFCRDQKGSGIVYVRSRRQTEELAEALRHNGVRAAHYHAGLASGERSQVQEDWMLDRTRVIVATIAFGMGIDKANVRFIVHFSPPDSLESYAQESGRAGRDGRTSICLLLTTAGDRATLARWMREESFDIERLRAIYAATGRQVRTVGKPTLVNFGLLLQDATERAGVALTDTDMRVGIGLMERVNLLVRHSDAPAGVTITVQGGLLDAPDQDFQTFCATLGIAPGRREDGALSDLANRLALSPLDLEARLLRWRDEGRIQLRSGGREPVVERLPAPADAGARMTTLLEEYQKAQLERIDQLFSFTSGDVCRHQALAHHMGHSIPACGDHCDNCRSGAAQHAAPRLSSTEQATRLEALLAHLRNNRAGLQGTPLTTKRALAIVDCVASLPYEVTKTAIAKVLTGRDGAAFSAGQVRGYGVLQGNDRFDVPQQIDALVDLGYLHADTRSGQRLISLGNLEAVAFADRARPAPAARDTFARGQEDGWESPFTREPRFEPAAEAVEAPPLPANAAQIMLECIASLPFPMGRTGVAKVLTGAHTAALDPDRCRHFGALAMCAQSAVGDKLLALVKAGYLRQETNEDNRPFLVLTAQGREETPPPDLVQLDYKHGIGPEAEQKRAAREAWRRGTVEAAAHLADDVAGADSADVADRFERLRLWRRTVAQREGVPPFMIFHDRVLDAMARAAVATLDDLRAVRGVGQVALAKYGPDLLAILAVEESPSEAPAVGDQADPGPGPAQ